MSESARPQSYVSTEGTVTIRQQPTVLLMVARVRAEEATLDLGLAEVRRLADDAVRRLTRLGATRAWAGGPHFDDQADLDSLAAQMRAARRRTSGAAPANRAGVNVAVAATWDIAELTADAVLALVDRLRFDVAANADPAAPPAAPPTPWADPMEQFQQAMAMAADPPEDRSPKFVYLAQAADSQLAQAAAEAYRTARRRAERLAEAAGLRLGGVSSLSYSYPPAVGRADQMMAQTQCAALLAAAGYELADGEVASDHPRTSEVTVCVRASHFVEG